MCVGKQLLNVCCGDCFATPLLEGACSTPQDGCCGRFKNMQDNDRINRNNNVIFRINTLLSGKCRLIRHFKKVPFERVYRAPDNWNLSVYPVVCCAECLWWPEGAFTLYAYYSMSVICDS